VAENVAFGLEMRKVPKSDRRARVAAALEMVRLGHLATRKVKALSGGQQQRIALARALVVEPTLLLLDEPLSNLDAKLRVSMRTEIRSIQQRLKATTLFVTHDQDEALDMSDRIAVMNNGLIEQFGPPTDRSRSSPST
jgi:putative spermidine/putrescine transport system ATP-binding protein